MVDPARSLLDTVRQELAPAESENRLVPLIERGAAARTVFATIAAEERRIVGSDWRSFLTLASRSDEPTAREFFSGLAQGEGTALSRLTTLSEAVGMDEAAVREYEPLAGCQAYPSYLAWLALNGEPADVIVAIFTNFAAWGSYCSRIARAMREQYGYDDDACGFFDFFATPAPGAEEQAATAVRIAIEAGHADERTARRYARMFQSYELMFWNTLADEAT